ncbi:MAG: EAL domain-containing protein [Propionivibrio sp.]
MYFPIYDVVAATLMAIGAAFCFVWGGERSNRATLAWGASYLALAVAAVSGFRHLEAASLWLCGVALLATSISLVAVGVGALLMGGRKVRLGGVGAAVLGVAVLLVVVSYAYGDLAARVLVTVLFVSGYAAAAVQFLFRLRHVWVGVAFMLEALAFLYKLTDWPYFSTPAQSEAVFYVQWVAHLLLALVLLFYTAGRSQRRLERVIRHFPDAVMVCDVDGRILIANNALLALTGMARPDDLVGRNIAVVCASTNEAAVFVRRVGLGAQGARRAAPETFECRFTPACGPEFPAEVSVATFRDLGGNSVIVQVRDMSERKSAEERIHDLAFHDQLTGLPNRRLLDDRLRQAINVSARSGFYGALMAIDLDHFKMINDTLGYEAGDRLLAEVAQRLQGSVREGDTVGRTGGDAFVLVLGGLGTSVEDAGSAASLIAEKCRHALESLTEFHLFDRVASASIGVVLFRGSATSAQDLLKQAEMSLYAAKGAGRNTVRFFDPMIERGIRQRTALEVDLRRALERGELFNVYQPQVADQRLVGAEALVRWNHPRRGLISPAEFIPLAEDTGLIVAIGYQVLEAACAQLALWSSDPAKAGLTIAVNVSAYQFRQHYFVDQVLAALRKTGANPRRLKLELTESLLVHDVESLIGKMEMLKARGVGFALDDFGSGYSSLAYLRRLPFEQLKIDQSFVRDVLRNAGDATIVRSIVALGRSLGLGVIAEGVETHAQRDFLSSVGCSACQGYLIGRPMPVGEFEAFAERIFAGVAPALTFAAPFKTEGSVPGYAQAFPQGA